MFFNRHEASFLKVGGFGGGESSTKSWQAKKKRHKILNPWGGGGWGGLSYMPETSIWLFISVFYSISFTCSQKSWGEATLWKCIFYI